MKQIIILETDAHTYAAKVRKSPYKVGNKILLKKGIVAEITNVGEQTYMIKTDSYIDMVTPSEIIGQYLGIVTNFEYEKY